MRIAVLSRSTAFYCTRRLLESGRELGHDMMFLPVLEGRLTIHDESLVYHSSGAQIAPPDAVIPRVGSYFPTFALAQLRALEADGVFALNSSRAIEASRDKIQTLLALSQVGLPVPRTSVVKDLNQIRATLDELGADSFVIKPLVGSQGRGVMLAETRESAASVLEGLIYLNEEVLVQEFLPGARRGDRRLLVLEGKVIGSIRRQPPADDFRTNFHRGGSGEPVETTDHEQRLALEATRALGLAFAGVDLLERDSGEPVVLEVNPSPGWEGLEETLSLDVARDVITAVAGWAAAAQEAKMGHGRDPSDDRGLGR